MTLTQTEAAAPDIEEVSGRENFTKNNEFMSDDEIIQLWDELSDFSANQADEALSHCLERVSEILHADNALWVGIVRVDKKTNPRRDRMLGWRVGASYFPNLGDHTLRLKKEALKEIDENRVGDTTIEVIANAGRFRTYTLNSEALVNLKEFKTTGHYDFFYRKTGIEDRMWVVMPISDDVESVVCFDTRKKGRSFTQDELEITAKIFRGIKWFHKSLLLHHGLGICLEPLTPSEERVKKLLLSGDTEKEISTKLSLTPGTVHQYAVRIYRKFGTNGRADFMSLWLRCLL